MLLYFQCFSLVFCGLCRSMCLPCVRVCVFVSVFGVVVRACGFVSCVSGCLYAFVLFFMDVCGCGFLTSSVGVC